MSIYFEASSEGKMSPSARVAAYGGSAFTPVILLVADGQLVVKAML